MRYDGAAPGPVIRLFNQTGLYRILLYIYLVQAEDNFGTWQMMKNALAINALAIL